ncbi:MAG: ATP-binding protein [Crocinitomicaceae bacterium]|nr:ATP-binding protein [Crocinitomicaceae bacterium]
MSELLKLISKGKGQQLEFEKELTNSQRIASVLVSFANTDGGSLLVGVKDNGKINGIDPSEGAFVLERMVNLFTRPLVEFDTVIWQEGHHLVLEVRIQKSNNMHFANRIGDGWAVFVRIGDRTCYANKIIQLAWKLSGDAKNSSKFSLDCQAEIIESLYGDAMTLSKLYSNANRSLKEVDYNLSYLIYKGVVLFDLKDDHFVYVLAQ